MNIPLRVLIVEDSPDDAELILRELRRGGFGPTYQRVDSSAGVEAALETQTWDIIISDHSMPGFNGFDVLRRVRQKDVDLPFILVSGTIGEDTAVAAMKAGAHDYLMKDNLTRLAPAVERVVTPPFQ
jgi:CheY-like chemotaxis protein